MSTALRIAVVGAESTGKTALVRELVPRLAATTGRRVAGVAEVLREWCDRHGRTPAAGEQAAIACEQHARIDAAAEAHDIVVCDTTALLTAVYSDYLFDDRSLHAEALRLHAGMAATLLTALDLPWVADGHQRDGVHVREPVDARLRELLVRHGLAFSVIGGHGTARIAQALAALAPLLRAAGLPDVPGAPRTPDAPGPPLRRGAWTCLCCSVPALERALFPAPAAPR